MKKIIKIFVACGLVLVILLGVLLALAKVYITPERVRQAVLPLAEDALGRRVELGAIDISIFSGISVNELKIHAKDGEGLFVSADTVVLKYQLLPLLAGKVLVDEVLLAEPRVMVTRNQDGTFNFADLQQPRTERSEKERSREQGNKDDGLNLLVSRVELKNGEIHFADYSMNAEKPFKTTVSRMNLSASNISTTGYFPFAVKLTLNGSAISIDGEINGATKEMKADVKVDGLDVVSLSPFYRDKLPATLSSMQITAAIHVQGGRETVASKGRVSLENVGLMLQDMPDMALKNAHLILDYDIQADMGKKVLNITAGKIDYNGIQINSSGSIDFHEKDPVLELQIATADLELQAAISGLPAKIRKQAGDFSPQGGLKARLHLAGPASNGARLLSDGEVTFSKVSVVVAGHTPVINGTVRVKGDSATTENLVLTVKENTARIDMQADNIYAKPVEINLAVNSDRFLLDPLMQSASAPAASDKQKVTGGKQKSKAEEPGPLDIPVNALGSVEVKRAVYKGVDIDDFVMRFELKKNILSIKELSGKTGGGSFSETAVIDLGVKGFTYSTTMDIKNVQAERVVPSFFPKAHNTIFGTMNFNTTVQGKGIGMETLTKSLTGSGELLLTDGKLTGEGLAQGLAMFMDLEKLRVLRFSKFMNSFSIENGKIKVASDVSGSDVRMAPKGTIGLDGALNLSLDARLSPELTKGLDRSGKFSRFLTDAQGWAQFPLKVTGTMGDPNFSLDTSGMAEKVQQKAVQEIQKRVEEKLFEKLAPSSSEQPPTQPSQAKPLKEGEAPAQQTQEQQDPTKQLLENTIRGLFNR